MTQATSAPEAFTPAEPAAPSPDFLAPTIEAILFSTDKPVSSARLAEVLGLSTPEDDTPAAPLPEIPAATDASTPDASTPPPSEPKPRGGRRKPKPTGPSAGPIIRDAVALLNTAYEQTGRSFRIETVAGGYRVMMLPQFAPAIAALQGSRARTSLSHAALESLAIISYKQPITRARLEAIRGVACGEILRSLTERRLVTVVGRAEEVGRPILYGTTKRFLELFGLSTLKDLPSVEELRPKT
jgi:segregation and condensation protein B